MILTKSEISALYVSLFGRASEGAGNKYWQDTAKANNWDYATVANKMLETKASKDFFGKALDSDAAFINHIYATTLNKGVDVDEAGKAFWIQKLTNKEVDRGAIVSELVKAALNPAYAHSKDPATKAAHELLTNKVIMSNVIADTVENIPAGKDIKEQLKPFVDINSNVKPIASKEDLKKIISDSKSALKIEENKLDTSVDTNSKTKILSEILHKPEKQIQKELDIDHTPKPKPDDTPKPKPDDTPKPKPDDTPKPKPDDTPKPKPDDTPKPKPDDTPKPKPDEPKNPDINDDSKDIEANLVQKADGFFARVTQEGKHYFIEIKDADNAGINLQADSKIILRGEQIFLKEGYKSLKAGIYTLKEANVDPTKAQLEAEEKIISIITPNKDKFIPKDQENGIKAGDFNSAIINTTEGYITKSDGKTLIEGTLNGNEATNVKDDKEGISNIYKIVKNGVVTYQIQSYNNITKGLITIDAKPGDIIDFIDDTQSIARVSEFDKTAANKKQFMLVGNDLHIIIYGNNAGDPNPNDDLVIIFKNVNLGKINIGQSAQGTSTGKFTLHQNILKEGLQKISDDDGFANLIGGENKTLFNLSNIDSLYKDTSGKYFIDAQGEQEINIFDSSNKLSVSSLKFTDGNIYVFYSNTKIDKTELENYTADKVLEKSKDGDQLITQNGIYTFSAPNKVSIIQSKNQDFEFTDTDNNDNITLEQAKSITKEKILNGEIETFINDGDKVKLNKTITLTFGANQEIKSIQNIIYADAIDILSKKIKDKIKDGAIEFKDTQAFDHEKLHSLISHTSKIKDSSIQNISLSIDEFLGDTVTTLSNKIKGNSIALVNENPFTLNQLKSIIDSGNSSKIVQYNITNIEGLSIEEAKSIIKLSSQIQAKSISITKSTSAQITKFIEDELSTISPALYEDIKIIKSSDNQEISLKSGKITGNSTFDFLSPEDKIKITNVDNSEIEYITHQNVDKFTIKSGKTLNLEMEQFKIAQSKLEGDGKIAISNVKDEIEGSSAEDTFVIANNVSNLTITKFDVSKDKINFGGLGIKNKDLNLISSTTNKDIANNTIYEIELGEALGEKDFGGANFDELFGAGKKFNITAPSSQNAVVIVKGTDKTQIYKIANTNATIESNDVSLLGTISGDNNSAVNLGVDNIIY